MIGCFLMTQLGVCPVGAQELSLPQPAIVTPAVNAIVKGLTIHPENPLQFDFIVEPTGSQVSQVQLKDDSLKMIKYFLASLAIPEHDMWVNLSPYEKNKIVPEIFGQTLMGRDLLAQDYVLKQITASLIHPDTSLGKEFWSKVYAQVQSQFGTTDVPINTFNKVWIVPDKATVWEHNKSVFVVDRHLKVMLEQDYLALEKIASPLARNDTSTLGSQIVRDIVIPALEKEVNEGASFAQLRQIYNAMILATWFKKNLKASLLGAIYVNKAKVQGVQFKEGLDKQKIYQQYLETFKKGVFNFIKEEPDAATGQMVPHKYFSGGAKALDPNILVTLKSPVEQLSNYAHGQLPGSNAMLVTFNATLNGGRNGIGHSVIEHGKLYENQSDADIRRLVRYFLSESHKPADPDSTNQNIAIIQPMVNGRWNVVFSLYPRGRSNHHRDLSPEGSLDDFFSLDFDFDDEGKVNNIQIATNRETTTNDESTNQQVMNVANLLNGALDSGNAVETFSIRTPTTTWTRKLAEIQSVVSADMPNEKELAVFLRTNMARFKKARDPNGSNGNIGLIQRMADGQWKVVLALFPQNDKDNNHAILVPDGFIFFDFISLTFDFNGPRISSLQIIPSTHDLNLMSPHMRQLKGITTAHLVEDERQRIIIRDDVIRTARAIKASLQLPLGLQPPWGSDNIHVDTAWKELFPETENRTDIFLDDLASFKLSTEDGYILIPVPAVSPIIEGQGEGETSTSDPMTVMIKLGVHGRPAALLVKLARKFNQRKIKSEIIYENQVFPMDSIMKWMEMAITTGRKLQVRAQGKDVEQIKQLFKEVDAILSDVNAAMPSPAVTEDHTLMQPPGGIDMNADLLNLSVKRDSSGMPLPAIDQNWAQLSVNGLDPVIINIQPVNLPDLIGTSR